MQSVKFGLWAGALTAGLMATSAANAIPTTFLPGTPGLTIEVPTGTSPSGFYFQSQIDQERLITGPGFFEGLGHVSAITDPGGVNTTYSSNGISGFNLTVGPVTDTIYLEFSGFLVDTITAPTSTTGGKIDFTGGELRYYVFAPGSPPVTNPDCGGQACQTADQNAGIANVKGGTPWLFLTPDRIDSANHTLEITIPAGNNSLTSFQNASATALLSVAPGGNATVSSFFNTCAINQGFANPFALGDNCSDIDFIGSANSVSAAYPWQVSGTDTVKARASASTLPEPATLVLFGSGLLSLGWAMRRYKQQQA